MEVHRYDNGDVRVFYDDYQELIEHANEQPNLVPDTSHSSRSTDGSHGRGWSGASNWPEAYKMLSEGWPEGVEKVVEIGDRIKRAFSTRMLELEMAYDYTGDEPDVAVYLEGDPEYMMNWNDEEVYKNVGQIVDIEVNCATHAGVDRNYIRNRGAAIMGMVDALTKAGFMTRITMMMNCNWVDNRQFCIEVLVKDTDQWLEEDRLAFALINEAYLRRVMFAIMEQHPEGKFRWGYGTESPLAGNWERERRGLEPSDMVFRFDRRDGNPLNKHSNWETAESSIEAALKAMVEKGLIEVKEEV